MTYFDCRGDEMELRRGISHMLALALIWFVYAMCKISYSS